MEEESLRTRLPQKIGLGRRAGRVEPSADIDLRMGLTAEVSRARRVRNFRLPTQDGELGVSALNDEPVHRVVGDVPANFAAKFLKGGHGMP